MFIFQIQIQDTPNGKQYGIREVSQESGFWFHICYELQQVT